MTEGLRLRTEPLSLEARPPATMSTRHWDRVLNGTLAERALDAAVAIATDLARLSSPEEIAPSYGVDVAASLGTGTAGLAMALRELDRAGIVPGIGERGDAFLVDSTDAMASEDMDPDFFSGFAGVAWAVAYLSAEDDEGADDPLAGVDPAIYDLVEDPGWAGPFDLVSGLVGFGVYALERLPRPSASRCVARIVDALSKRAEPRGRGLAWRTRSEHLSPLQQERNPEGWYDLGVAHGVPGIVAFLAQACAAGVEEKAARELLDGAVEWVLEERAASTDGLPFWIPLDGDRHPARNAWCYGDPGVAAVLLLAGRCVGQRSWEATARDIALEAAARPLERAGVVDASLCHGAAGLAHLYNRVFQRTGDGDLGRAAREWFERALSMRSPGIGHGGYLTALKAGDGSLTYEADPSLLSGAAGIAMALGAAVSAVEPGWDRLLLLSSRFER